MRPVPTEGRALADVALALEAERRGQGWLPLESPRELQAVPGIRALTALRKGNEIWMALGFGGQGQDHLWECQLDERRFDEEWARDPLEGTRDFPGRDLAGIPRPRDSVRAFSMLSESSNSGLASYRLDSTLSQAAQAYAADLTACGWRAFNADPAGQAACYVRGRELCVVWHSVSAANDKPYTTVMYYGESR